MPDVKISALPTASIVGLSDIFVLNQGGITKTASKSLVIAGLATTDQIGGLNSAQVQALTSAQIAAITPATIGAVATSDIIGISKGGTGATDAVSALSALGGITSAALAGFASTSQLSGFATTTQIVGIAFTSQLSAFATTAQISGFTNTAQVSAIASAQISALMKDVTEGIRKVKSMPLFITRRSVNMIKEIKNYKWKTDKNDRVLDEPVKFNDHAMDAGRYGTFTHLTGFQFEVVAL